MTCLRLPLRSLFLLLSALFALACSSGGGTAPGSGGADTGGGAAADDVVEGPPQPVSSFRPVRLRFTDDASGLREVALFAPGRGHVVYEIGGHVELWVVADGTVEYALWSTGDVSQLVWNDQFLFLNTSGDEDVVVHEGADGAETTYGPEPGTSEAALTLEELDERVEETLRFFTEFRHHPIVERVLATVEELAGLQERLDDYLAEHDAFADPADPPAELVSDAPVAAAEDVAERRFTAGQLVTELADRTRGDEPATRHLPETVAERDPETDTLAPSDWTVSLVPCLKDWRAGSVLALEQYACAGTRADCEAAGGTPFEARPDCRGWCTAQAAEPVQFASWDATTDVLSCSRHACVEAFSTATAQRPLTDEAACAAGCSAAQCEDEPEPDPGPDAGGGPVDPDELDCSGDAALAQACATFCEVNARYNECDQRSNPGCEANCISGNNQLNTTCAGRLACAECMFEWETCRAQIVCDGDRSCDPMAIDCDGACLWYWTVED